MKRVMPYIVLCLMIASILAPVGIGYAMDHQPNLVPYGYFSIKEWGFSVSPAKYAYRHNGSEKVTLTIENLTDIDETFLIGDDKMIVYPGMKGTYTTKVHLEGQTQKITITRVDYSSGLHVNYAFELKIEPEKKGGEP